MKRLKSISILRQADFTSAHSDFLLTLFNLFSDLLGREKKGES